MAERHNFRPDFPSADAATQLAYHFINDPAVFGVVAESGGRVVGSNFLSEWDAVRSVGPITVDPNFQARGTGRRRLAALRPKTLALMHGSSYVGDGGRALLDLSAAMREVLGGRNGDAA